jgi:hypothetical protein
MSGPFKMKNSGLAYSAKHKTPIQYSSPAKSAIDPTHDENGRRIMSVSDEQTQIDLANLANAANSDKQGGSGDGTVEQQEITEKSRKRQAVIEAQNMTRSELKENAKGSKWKKFWTPTSKLKSEVTAQNYRNAKGKRGQVLQKGDVSDIDTYSGVKEEETKN